MSAGLKLVSRNLELAVVGIAVARGEGVGVGVAWVARIERAESGDRIALGDRGGKPQRVGANDRPGDDRPGRQLRDLGLGEGAVPEPELVHQSVKLDGG